MKRDMDIIRAIVLDVRNAEDSVAGVEGISKEDFVFHAQLLDEAGLVHAATSGGGVKPAANAIIWRLSWTGHDFADSIVDDTIWNKAKENILKPAASWSFGILLEYLKYEIKSNIPGLDKMP